MHIEPGIWIVQEKTTYPPAIPPGGGNLVARLGTIPHGNSLLAQGTAVKFGGPPVLSTPAAKYNGSVFPSFNSTPFGVVPPPGASILCAEGSSQALVAAAFGVPPFNQYNLLFGPSATNPRTPFSTSPPEPPLPANINGVAMQDVINDPIKILQATIERQLAEGYSFEGVAINISTQASITFFQNANSGIGGPTVVINPPNGAGGIENILFLQGGDPVGAQGPNANTATVYATFWIETLSHPDHGKILQLQYAQMVVLDFEILKLLPASPLLGWPHVSVATLRKSFRG